MTISPDQHVLLDLGSVKINATLVFTWLTIALRAGLARWATPQLSTTGELSPWQNLLEVLVKGIQRQIRDIARQDPGPFLSFIATLFIFIAACNLLAVVPGYQPPTGSLSTTTALALCVFVAAPLYGIRRLGLRAYLRNYLKPTPLMLPLNIVGELAHTLALAVRLYGNVMSSRVRVGIAHHSHQVGRLRWAMPTLPSYRADPLCRVESGSGKEGYRSRRWAVEPLSGRCLRESCRPRP